MKIIIAAVFLVCPLFAAGEKSPRNATIPSESENGIGVYGGMGIHLVSAPSIVRYVNASAQSSGTTDDWGTAIEFFGGMEVPILRSWAVKLEYSFMFKSYTLAAGSYSQDLRYDVQAPMIMAQYVLPGKGYFLKFSGGGGYHWGTVIPPKTYGVETRYTAKGPGVRMEAEGQTAFDTHLFGYMSGTVGYEFLGKVTSERGQELANGGGAVSINYLAAGVRFGLMYYF
jgi:hypothetical protein